MQRFGGDQKDPYQNQIFHANTLESVGPAGHATASVDHGGHHQNIEQLYKAGGDYRASRHSKEPRRPKFNAGGQPQHPATADPTVTPQSRLTKIYASAMDRGHQNALPQKQSRSNGATGVMDMQHQKGSRVPNLANAAKSYGQAVRADSIGAEQFKQGHPGNKGR